VAIQRPRLIAVIYAFSGMCVALMLSWLILAVFNFSYGFWHDYGGIGGAIDQYGPENKFRSGFHLTTKDQRETLFAEIVRCLHGDADGLSRIEYQVDGHPKQTLLTEPEVIHLKDVARLIHVGAWVAFAALLVWLASIVFCIRYAKPFPTAKNQLFGLIISLSLLGIVVWVSGPVALFYLLHTWVFPDGHAWFFYYQESLMSTMMYAPYLFGWIALEWLALSLLVYIALQYSVYTLSRAIRVETNKPKINTAPQKRPQSKKKK
jgi:Protein of unknown function (DUF1461)